MPSNLTPNLSQLDLKKLHKLLSAYARHICGEQPMAARIIEVIIGWVFEDIDQTK